MCLLRSRLEAAKYSRQDPAHGTVVLVRVLLLFESAMYSAITPVLPHYAHVLHASKLKPEQRSFFHRNIAASAESGWDFSARWFSDDSMGNLVIMTAHSKKQQDNDNQNGRVTTTTKKGAQMGHNRPNSL